MRYPRAFSHIGITVPDLDKAVKFYSEVMGWYIIMPPTDVTEEKVRCVSMYLVKDGRLSG